MNTNRKISTAVIALALVAAGSSSAQDNPHWNETTCQTCHAQTAPVDGDAALREGQQQEALCDSCHGDRGGALSCRHQSGFPAEASALEDIFRPELKDGKVVCTTCHDVVYQCQRPKAYNRLENPAFLRDRKSRHTADYCSRCHDTQAIERLNPHRGVAATPPSATCALCHESIPNASPNGQIELAFNAGADLNTMCTGCHKIGPHPKNLFARNPSTGWVHLVVPPDQILRKMRETEQSKEVSLPLEPGTGKIFCATCHSPHDFKVGGEHGAQAGTPHKLRTNNICQACHEK